MLQADERTRFLVLEMGARGPGHIRYLCGIARPDVGVVVNVGVAHIGEFGSVDRIAAAKGELSLPEPPLKLVPPLEPPNWLASLSPYSVPEPVGLA